MKYYIELKASCKVSGDGELRLSDIAEALPTDERVTNALKSSAVRRTGRYMTVSALTVIKALSEKTGAEFESVGESECCVVFEKRGRITVWVAAKVLFIAAVLFFGGAVSIMTFHEDVGMSGVIERLMETFGTKNAAVGILPYCIGTAAGFIFISGVFKRKKSGPSLVDIDLNEHESDVCRNSREIKEE